jgi:hypothetical protein
VKVSRISCTAAVVMFHVHHFKHIVNMKHAVKDLTRRTIHCGRGFQGWCVLCAPHSAKMYAETYRKESGVDLVTIYRPGRHHTERGVPLFVPEQVSPSLEPFLLPQRPSAAPQL